jgi:hypothetical protein
MVLPLSSIDIVAIVPSSYYFLCPSQLLWEPRQIQNVLLVSKLMFSIVGVDGTGIDQDNNHDNECLHTFVSCECHAK